MGRTPGSRKSPALVLGASLVVGEGAADVLAPVEVPERLVDLLCLGTHHGTLHVMAEF